MDIWVRIAQLALSLAILIVLHEFGHFIPARLFKIRVEKFYLFFDPYFALVKKKIGQTEWGIGWLPLGGYVKIAGMVDESMDKDQMAQPPKPDEFRAKPAWQRLIVMIGGVTVNVIVGFLIFIMLIFVWGEDKLDQSKMTNGLAVHPYMEQFGFRSGDRILEIDGKRPEILSERIAGEIMIFNKRHFKVQHQDGSVQNITLPENIGQDIFQNGAEATFGFRTFMEEITHIAPNTTAEKMKLKTGDKIVAVNGKDFLFYDEFQNALFHNKGKEVTFLVKRGGKEFEVAGKVSKEGILGIRSNQRYSTDTSAVYHQDYGFVESIGKGITKGAKTLYSTVAQFKYVFTKKGAGSVGGFGTIAKLFPTSWDWQTFWAMTGLLSFTLAFMNILPIPALDGGHVMFLLYEMITGRQPAQKVLETAQYIGFFLLIGLLLYANGNDLIRSIFG